MAKRALLLHACWFLCSCSSPEEAPIEIWTTLFDPVSGISMAASPPTIAQDGANSISIRIRPLYAGKGYAHVIAQESNEPIGHIIAPSDSEFGSIRFPLTFVSGEAVESEFVVQFYPGRSSVGLTAQATYDSLTIGGVVYPIDSPESRAQIGPFAISTITAYSVLKVEESINETP